MNVSGGDPVAGDGMAQVSRRPLAAAIAGALLLLASAANAQQGAAPGDNVAELDAVVVTANKRVENVRRVGSSISVIGEDQLEKIGANQLADYADFVPGLQVQDAGSPGLTSVSLRGIAALSSGATVATYIDEVPVGSSGLYQSATALMLDLLPYDINRVEVLRGPQGTLYGAGSIGGLLKYVTNPPDMFEPEFRVGFGLSQVSGGETGWNGRFGASLPLANDRLGLRLSYAHRENPGYTDNAVTDGFSETVLAIEKDVNASVQTSARVALAYEGDRFNMGLSALRQSIESDDRSGVATDLDSGRPLFGDKVTRAWYRQPFSKDVELLAATLEWDLGWADLVSASGVSRTSTSYLLDATVQYGEITTLLGLPEYGSAYVDYRLDLDKVTQELRLTSKSGGRFEWMFGGFYTDEDADQSQLVFLNQFDGSPLPPPMDQMFGDMVAAYLPSTYREVAVFANGAWRVSDRFKIDAGMRYARNDQRFTQLVTVDPVGLVGAGESGGDSRESVFTWSLSPQFQLSDDVLLYAKAATGYQPGGPNVAMAGMPAAVDSSMVTSYEAGLKSEFFDKRFLFDLAAFRIDWEDIQVSTIVNGVAGLVNGGQATSTGLELTTRFRATDRLTFGLNGAYTSADLDSDFEAVVIDQDPVLVEIINGLGGDRMPNTPKLSWSATAEYAFYLGDGRFGGNVGAAFRRVGDRITGTSSLQRVVLADDPSVVLQETFEEPGRVGSYHALDLYANLGDGRWNVRVYANNVTDELGYSSSTLLSGALTGTPVQRTAVPIQPRTFGLEFDYRF